MIGQPLNDHRCLGQITEVVAELVNNRDPEVAKVAERVGGTEALAAWIRGLPQRDDVGHPGDGPKAEACSPPQRLRIPAPDPNCVERAALYLAAGELLDPRPVRRLATIETPAGFHTFPVENEAPVVLDPKVRRNALEAGLFQMQDGPVAMTPGEAVEWVCALAAEPAAAHRNGLGRVQRARSALRGVLDGRPVQEKEAGDVGFALALADREARMFGRRGVAVMRTTLRALSDIERLAGRRASNARRNAPEVRLGRYRLRPNVRLISALARVGGRVGTRVGTEALRHKLASMGASPMVLGELEGELNREGLTLGALAAPPAMPGTLEAVTPDAMLGRWVAARLGWTE